MVLKEKKAGVPKKTAKVDNDAASILSRIESSHTSNILPSLKAHLEPVCKLDAPSGKENASDADKHRIAKQFVPFLAQVLKLCSSGLSKLPISDDVNGKLKADELFLSLEFALDCFEHLRQWLVGSPLEIEMQRSWLVRRLIAWRRFREALNQDLTLLRALCTRVFGPDKTDVISKYREDILKLPHPDHAKDLTEGAVVLIVGAATDFIVCAAEIGIEELPLFEKVIVVAQNLDPWLSKLEADKAGKQRSLLFRELNKCVMAIVLNNSHEQPELVEAFACATLHLCALSSMSDHFCKVARSICSRLSSQGPLNGRLAIKVCEEALAKISQMHQLQGVRGTHEMLELVECYARLCQTSKRNLNGWEHICRAIGRNTKVLPLTAVAGYYAVGLVLACNPFDTNCQSAVSDTCTTLSPDRDLEQRVCNVLEGAIEAVQKVLACFGTGLKFEPIDPADVGIADLRERKNLVIVYRALDFLRRSAFSYAQLQWDAFISRSEDFHMPLELHGALRHCLLLFCKLVNIGLGCGNLTPDESELFRKGGKSFLPAANAAFRLSLLKQDRDMENVMLINNFMAEPFAGPEELRWLMSSSYNMGVQLFNMKLQELACEPFRIAHAAAWERVSRASLNQASNISGPLDSKTTDFIDIVSDACAKSNILFDTLKRSNHFQEALNVFCQSVGRWARSGLAGLKKHSPHSFLQLWLKKTFAMKLDQEKDAGENVICFFILNFDPPLPPDAVGLLLEEELFFYDSMEESESGAALQMKKKILDLLLNRVYTTNLFFLQQSKILLEKGRLCRLHNVEGYNDCLSYLTQAINILADNLNMAGDNYIVLACVKLQLAMGYFLRAVCLEEINPSKNDCLEDILNGSRLCEGLFSCKTFLDESFLAQIPAATGLLHNVADLLAFKGYSTLQYGIYGLLLDIASASHADPEEAFAVTFMNRKLSHLFCCSPFLHTLKNLVQQKLGLDLDSKDLLQNLVRKNLDGMLSVFLSEILNEFSRDASDVDFGALSSWTEMSRTSDDSKTNESISKLSQALFMLAECRISRGNLEEAFRNAKEALRCRLKLLNRSFKILSKSPMVVATEADPSVTNQKVIYLEALGYVAVNSWPNINLGKKSEAGPSQWQIIGDYLESLMQVGVLSEMLGFVDDAESSFREGCQIAKSQSLPFAEGLFQSCLGETQRKRHLWELAKSSFESATQLLDQHEIGLSCQQCRQLARACLEFRVADFERHRSNGSSMESIQTSKLALDGYESAEKRLLNLVTELSNARPNSSETCGVQYNQGDDMRGKELQDSSISSMEDKMCCRNRLRNSARTGSLRTYKASAGEGESFSEVLCEIVPEIESCSLPKPCLADESAITVLNEHTDTGPEIGYRTRRKASAKAKGRKGSPLLPEDTIEDLCAETSTKLNIKETRLRKAGKSQLATETIQKVRRPSTRSKCSGVDSVDKLSLECSSALGEEKISEDAATKDVKPAVQGFHNYSREKSCLLHKSSRICKEKSSLHRWLNNKWIVCIRRLMARVLLQKGKCLINLASAHEVHTQFYRALAVLREGNWSALESSDSSSLCGPECLSTKAYKLFRIEEGCLFYHISMFALRQESSKSSRDGCCFFESVDVSKGSKWLCDAFVLCREMPPLLCKIARILAILHVPKNLGGPFDCSSIDGFQSSRTAPYFHQISLGATTRQQHLCALDARKTSHLHEKLKMPDLFDTSPSIDEMQHALRIGPSTSGDLHSAIQENIELPCSTVCLSLVDGEMRYLYSGLNEGPKDAWLLVSRFDTDLSPLSIILPCPPLPERVGASCCPYTSEGQDEVPSDVQSGIRTAFGNLVTKFKIILDESRQSTSGVPSLNSVEEKCRWWEWRMDLDSRLASLLRAMEDIWLGPWKSILLGNCSVKGSDVFRCSAKDLKKQLESMINAGPLNVDLIQLLLQGVGSLTRGDLEKGIAWLLDGKMSTLHLTNAVLSKASQALQNGTFKSLRGGLLSSAVEAFIESFQAVVASGACLPVVPLDETNPISCDAVQKNLLRNFESMEELDLYREPVTLVLDGNLQALPWESLPVLRKKEVYRVPSLGSMKALMIQRSFLEARSTIAASRSSFRAAATSEASLPETMFVTPTIDPSNAYFLLNPSGDLGSTQAAFEDMFKTQQGWEGKVGQVPTVEEYMDGLQRHELFVYFGHGSGDQYLPERRMRKMNRCAAALLMGCSSGRLSLRGDYEPVGVPLWYLMAGCPTAIANLWDVTDGDIDRFSRVLLHNWLETDGAQAKAVTDPSSKLKDPIQGQCHKGKKRSQKLCKGEKSSATPMTSSDKCFPRGAITASHIGEGRNTCRLPNLIGASPVCYGIPTLIIKKRPS